MKNDESTYLLARTYYLSGDINKSYWLLRNSSIEHVPLAKLLLAKCCLETDKYVWTRWNSIFLCRYFRLHEAESVLIGNSSSINTLALDDFVNDHTDQAAFALQLLAKVCEWVRHLRSPFEFRLFSSENLIDIKKQVNAIENRWSSIHFYGLHSKLSVD